jgi:molybdate/tungstate transport system substrate-binding protein
VKSSVINFPPLRRANLTRHHFRFSARTHEGYPPRFIIMDLFPPTQRHSLFGIRGLTPCIVLFTHFLSVLAALPSWAAQGEISILYAGSLGNFVEKDIGPAFSRATGYKYLGEAKGSLLSANLIKGGLRTPDVFISADPNVNQLLMGAQNGHLVRWYATIFGNAMVLGYNPQSRFAAELRQVSTNDVHLYEILQEKGFRLGCGDPELEPKGYRTVFVFDLAEKFYQRPGLALGILHGSGHSTSIYPEEQLVARLEAGQLDAGIFYRNEVAEHNLPFIAFPREIDLSDPNLDDNYSAATYVSPKGTRYNGSAIVYSITIPENSQNRGGAAAFVSYLLSDDGGKIIKRHALHVIQPVVSGELEAVPLTLQTALKNVTSP